MVPFDDMPDDNAQLASLSVEFERLHPDSAESCPILLSDLLDYLGMEAPGGERLDAADLTFVRTAQLADVRYWIWRFQEPDGGDHAFATVALDEKGIATIGYGTDYYGLTAEQYLLGDYHQVF